MYSGQLFSVDCVNDLRQQGIGDVGKRNARACVLGLQLARNLIGNPVLPMFRVPVAQGEDNGRGIGQDFFRYPGLLPNSRIPVLVVLVFRLDFFVFLPANKRFQRFFRIV